MGRKKRVAIRCVYRITSPTGQFYIGSTSDMIRRFQQHKRGSSGSKKIQKSFEEHGFENHYFQVIECCNDLSIKELREREFYWIRKTKSNTGLGLNIATGYGSKGLKISQKQIEIISKNSSREVHAYNLSGHYLRSFKSQKMASIETGANYSNISTCCTGGISSCGGYLWSYEKKNFINPLNQKSQPRPFLVFRKNGKYVGEFLKINECTKLGVVPSNAGRCLSGKRMSANGYIFVYKDEYKFQDIKYVPAKRPKTNKLSKRVVKTDLNDKYIETYPSLTSAAKSENRSTSDVKKCCEGFLSRSGQFKWIYESDYKK